MHLFPTRSCFTTGAVLFLICLTISPAAAADIEMEGYLGETITLHGVSYVGDAVYLFLTGPGLPANGVTLTDTTQRADQGEFTMVRVNDDQEWTYVWKTSRISNEIDPGTYIVYVTNEPVDKAHLGGTSSYKTLSIFLKDSGTSKVSIDSGKTYTMNPEEHVSTPRPAPSINMTSPPTVVTSLPPSTTVPPAPVQTTVPPTKAATGSLVVVIAILGCVCLFSHLKNHS
jgi:hypothetical protein